MPGASKVSAASFARPFEVYKGVHVYLLDGRPIKRLVDGDTRPCPEMWLDGDYLVLSTGHRLHLAGGLVAWVKA